MCTDLYYCLWRTRTQYPNLASRKPFFWWSKHLYRLELPPYGHHGWVGVLTCKGVWQNFASPKKGFLGVKFGYWVWVFHVGSLHTVLLDFSGLLTFCFRQWTDVSGKFSALWYFFSGWTLIWLDYFAFMKDDNYNHLNYPVLMVFPNGYENYSKLINWC